MDYMQSIILGFQVALQWNNLLFCFIGVLIGTLVGVLPGLGPVAAISLLLPTTFHVTPVSAIIMLAGIYYGAMYGGSTTSILLNVPGETASVITCIDGYQMARKGRAGPALAICARRTIRPSTSLAATDIRSANSSIATTRYGIAWSG